MERTTVVSAILNVVRLKKCIRSEGPGVHDTSGSVFLTAITLKTLA
jgi:hypothetical protein